MNKTVIELTQGDITREDTEAIVNAANSSLLGGGGVDGAIHRAAGPELLQATRELGGCQTGDAKITAGYRLKAQYVIHAVGPIYQRGNSNVPKLLASAYQRSLEVGIAQGITTIAFPAISTGAYGYPAAEAAEVALHTITDFAQQHAHYHRIRLVLFDEPTWQIYSETLARMTGSGR